MDGWKVWQGKKVFLRTRNNRVYSGEVTSVDDSNKQIIFLTIRDKFGMLISITTSEITEIKEEN